MITPNDIRKLEDKSEEAGISKLQLMANAGRGIYTVLSERLDLKNKKILVVCYHGNNGGDGFVAANHLSEIADVTVLFVGDEAKLKKEAAVNYKKLLHNPQLQLLFDADEIDFSEFDIIIDAVLGTGVAGDVKEPISALIDYINNSGSFKVSVDIPTGLNPDTGEAVGKMVNADLIITFHDLKPGLRGLEDKTVVIDIGIPNKV